MGACQCCPKNKEGQEQPARLPEFEDDGSDFDGDKLAPNSAGFGQYERVSSEEPAGERGSRGESGSQSRGEKGSVGREYSSQRPSRERTGSLFRRKSSEGKAPGVGGSGARGGSAARSSPDKRRPDRTQVKLPNGDLIAAGLHARFLASEGGNRKKAALRCQETLAWRRRERADFVLSEAAPQFWRLKAFVPHCYHGKDREGRVVLYQRPGMMRLKLLAEHGLDLKHPPDEPGSPFVRHYIYQEEFLATHMHRSEDDSAIKVIDLAGLKKSDLTSEVRRMMKSSMQLGRYYPGRTSRLVIVNKPVWAALVLTLFKSLLSNAEQKKMVSFSPSATLKGLQEFIALENIPRELGGQSKHPMGCAPEEVALYAHARLCPTRESSVKPLLPQHADSTTGYLPPSPVGFWQDHAGGSDGTGGDGGGDRSSAAGRGAAAVRATLADIDPAEDLREWTAKLRASSSPSSPAAAVEPAGGAGAKGRRVQEEFVAGHGEGAAGERNSSNSNSSSSDGRRQAEEKGRSRKDHRSGEGGTDGDDNGRCGVDMGGMDDDERADGEGELLVESEVKKRGSKFFSFSKKKKNGSGSSLSSLASHSSSSTTATPNSTTTMSKKKRTSWFAATTPRAGKHGENVEEGRLEDATAEDYRAYEHDDGDGGEEVKGGTGGIGMVERSVDLSNATADPLTKKSGKEGLSGGGDDKAGDGSGEGSNESPDVDESLDMSVTTLDNDVNTIFFCDQCTYKGTFEAVRRHEHKVHKQ